MTPEPSASDAHPVRLNGPVLRFAMRAAGMSQKGLARQIGVHDSTLSRALRGETTTTGLARAIVNGFAGRLLMEEVVDLGGLSPALPAGAQDHDPPA